MSAKLASLLLAAPLLGLPAEATSAGSAKVTWNAPTRFVKGLAFPVSIRIEAPEDGASIADWLLTPGAFLLNNRPVQERESDGIVTLAPGAVLTLDFDLGPAIQSSAAYSGKDFQLGFAKEYLENEPVAVRVFQRAPADLDYMALRAEELIDYQVIVETNRGSMTFELFPDVAPIHVRNFLDLCQSGFYVDTLFHRVSPNFMIQGGDPNTKASETRRWGEGKGPRTLDLEASELKHERGILSMARGNEPNTASCQFFVMTTRYPSLDGKYSAFGRLVAGDDTLDRISRVKGSPIPQDPLCVRPHEPQRILSTTIIRASRPE